MSPRFPYSGARRRGLLYVKCFDNQAKGGWFFFYQELMLLWFMGVWNFRTGAQFQRSEMSLDLFEDCIKGILIC